MALFSKKKYLTSTDETTLAINRLADDILVNTQRRENALSSFRRTANELADINEQLTTRKTFYETLTAALTDQKSQTDKMIADNEAVRKKILEIIGE